MEGRKKKRVYVAGPMSGYENWNYQAFDAAAADLRSRGYEAINPVDLDREVGFDPATSSPEDFDLPAAIRRDIEAILSCQAIVMLPGHENSKGATAERHVAHWGGLDVLVYPSLVKYGDEPLLADQIPDDLWNDDGTLRVEDLELLTVDKKSHDNSSPTGMQRELLECFGVEDTGPSPQAVKNVAYVPADFADDEGVKEWLGRNGVKPEDIRVVHDRESLGDKIVKFATILKDNQTIVQPVPGERLRQLEEKNQRAADWLSSDEGQKACRAWSEYQATIQPIAGEQVWDDAKKTVETDEEDILSIAYRITRGDRQSSYGPPDQDFRRTAEMWTALFKDNLKDGKVFEPFHVAQFMILVKMSRQLHQRKADNWIDVAGYARCGWICDQSAAKSNAASSA